MRRLALSLEQGPELIGRQLSENQLRVQFWTIVSRVLCFRLAFRVSSHERFPVDRQPSWALWRKLALMLPVPVEIARCIKP